MPKPFQGHFNPSVGRYVNSMADFKAALARGSDEASERLGFEHRYVPIEAGEAQGVTEEGLESQARFRRNAGLDEPKSKILT